MSIRYSDDVILPPTADLRSRLRPAVFLPLAIALIGLAGILAGGLSVGDWATTLDRHAAVDPIVTGSIQPVSFEQMSPAEQRHALEMLDR